MKYLKVIIFFLLMNSFLTYSQMKVSFDENKLQINWELVTNNYKNEEKALSSFTFTNNGKTDFPSSGWTLYFNNFQKIYPRLSSGDFIVSHLNGDLFQMKPTKKFQGLKGNQSLSFTMISQGLLLNLTRVPSGFYIVWDTAPEKGYGIKNYILKPIEDSSINFITAENTFKNNEEIEDIPLEKLPKIFPTPKYFQANEGVFLLDNKVIISAEEDFLEEAKYLSNELAKVIESQVVINPKGFNGKQIILKKADLGKEAYILDIKSDTIEILASTSAGIFYGIQSLKSILPSASWKTKSPSISIVNCYVKDEPRFEFRSFMLDVARNFQTKETIFKILDAMSLYKMNAFHFHFSDDEGWRIEIPSLPELTDVGSNRGHTLDSASFLPPAFGSGPNIGVY
ncbi:MAG: family 20 glycosylhydrolase, partial [Lutibacter sp.]